MTEEIKNEINRWSNKLAKERQKLNELQEQVEVSKKSIFLLQDFIDSLKNIKSETDAK